VLSSARKRASIPNPQSVPAALVVASTRSNARNARSVWPHRTAPSMTSVSAHIAGPSR